jgi:Protein of unknown function (DUF1326)
VDSIFVKNKQITHPPVDFIGCGRTVLSHLDTTMKTLLSAASLFLFVSGNLLGASAVPSGEVIELHACELYTGGCTASAQSTLGGRSLLRIWSFDNGVVDGIDIHGLRIAALEVADKNLALAGTRAGAAVIYVPAQASETQRRVLVSWLKKQNPELASADVTEKITDVALSRKGSVVSARVGDHITLRTRAIEHCDAGGCGEALWYTPRSNTGEFTVLVNDQLSLREPAVSLVWKESGVRSVFLARFGAQQKSGPSFSLAFLD